ncbi:MULTISPECIES: MFS transporter [unclassified Thermosynechococcus]|uniref:MFS transporter n=1 Tax=unclassified Thermosynechococcus TaxID=2622553 RepID=UPI0019DF7D66|nr:MULTISPECIES: MFS transporter [unclassified Thermosynechococcus]HIK35947.1 MFS transporter [Thermosynechococcus sp. M98_K2018_005]HIK49222.1 MFS transporter [Thermosynechococcus sp. M55_K2018_012]
MVVLLKLPPSVRQTLLRLVLAGLLFWSSIAAMLPTLPLYIAEKGGTPHQVGFVMGAFAVGLIGSRSWLGSLADRQGRKITLLIGLAVAAIAPLFYIVSHNLPLLVAVRLLHGLSIAGFTTGYMALVTDIAPPQHRGEIIGYTSLVHPIGVALGPSLGSWLQMNYSHGSVFMTASSLAALGFMAAAGVQAVNIPQDPGVPRPEKALFWRLLLSERLRIPSLVMLSVGLTFGTIATFMPLFIATEGFDISAGLFYSVAAIASFMGRVATGSASDRWGRGIFISASLACYFISMVLLAQAQTSLDILWAAILEGLAGGVVIPMVAALMADRSTTDERGRVLSLSLGGFDLGMALAGPLLGGLIDPLGYRLIFRMAAVFSLLGLTFFLTASSKSLPDSLRFALGMGRDRYAL